MTASPGAPSLSHTEFVQCLRPVCHPGCDAEGLDRSSKDEELRRDGPRHSRPRPRPLILQTRPRHRFCEGLLPLESADLPCPRLAVAVSVYT